MSAEIAVGCSHAGLQVREVGTGDSCEERENSESDALVDIVVNQARFRRSSRRLTSSCLRCALPTATISSVVGALRRLPFLTRLRHRRPDARLPAGFEGERTRFEALVLASITIVVLTCAACCHRTRARSALRQRPSSGDDRASPVRALATRRERLDCWIREFPSWQQGGDILAVRASSKACSRARLRDSAEDRYGDPCPARSSSSESPRTI